MGDAQDGLNKLLRRREDDDDLIAFAEAAVAAGSVANAVREVSVRLDAMKADEADLRADQAKAAADHNGALERLEAKARIAQKTLKNVQDAAERVADKAAAAAARTKAEADEEAKRIRLAAEAEAEAIVMAAQAAALKAEEGLSQTRLAADETTRDIVEARALLASINKEIAQVKAKFA